MDGPIIGQIYYRTSKSGEGKTVTIDQQRPLTTAAINAYNIECPWDPITDRGVSGQQFPREGLEDVEERAAKGRLNVLIVSDIDRIGRICEKTIEFAKRLRNKYDVCVISAVRWYDVDDADDLETFAAKSGRAEAENKKRGERGNRGKLFKLVENGSDAYLSWFNSVPAGFVESDPTNSSNMGIEPADDERVDIPNAVLKRFVEADAPRKPFKRAEELLEEDLPKSLLSQVDLDIKQIVENPVYVGRTVLKLNNPQTHGIEQSEICVEMDDLQIVDHELWVEAREKLQRVTE